MSALADAEIRRILKFLRGKIEDIEELSSLEDELRGEFGAEFLRETDISKYFPTETVEISRLNLTWKLKIISYTRMRMKQRGIGDQDIIILFEKFLEFCAARNQVITVGAYTVYGRATPRSSNLTLRIDIDKTNETENRAHTVTVFVGRGDILQTEEISRTYASNKNQVIFGNVCAK